MLGSNNVQTARDTLIEDFRKVVTDTESLLGAMSSVPGEKAAALRATVEENLAGAKRRLREAQGVAVEKATAVAKYTDEYVHENPWTLIGGAAGVGLIGGLLIASERR